jgi:hypothetical protein
LVYCTLKYKSNILIKKNKIAAIYWTDGDQVFEQRAWKPHYTKRSNNKNVLKFSRNMFTEIRCEICINHFVEIIFTLSCAVGFYARCSNTWSPSVRLSVCKIFAIRNSPDCNHAIDRCEICINHFVEIIFTLSCAVVDINLLQINCSQNFLLKMCKKNCTDIHW